MDQKTVLVRQLRAFARTISHEYPLKTMILFGSQATGRAGKHSDIDLILVSHKFTNVRRIKRSPALYLKWDLEYPVDFICLTPEEFEKKKRHSGVVQQALKEGIEIA